MSTTSTTTITEIIIIIITEEVATITLTQTEITKENIKIGEIITRVIIVITIIKIRIQTYKML